jgi:NitT/TauT family transport system ATP-binding protein/nitrate/nitrite transport system substrate-binding protein
VALLLADPPAAPTVQASRAPRVITLGFVPLTDAAPLLVADELGLFRARGLEVALAPSRSWAALRDRLAHGTVQGAQLLAPLALAANAGLDPLLHPLGAGLILSREGNTIVLGASLLDAADAPLAARMKTLGRLPVFGVVHGWSSHAYLLRHWLAARGIDPDRDVAWRVIPPPRAPEFLAEGTIDGFCAGEPWGSLAQALGLGRVVISTGAIAPGHAEKLLVISEAVGDRAVPLLAAVLGAIAWLADAANHDAAARMISYRAMPQVPVAVLRDGLARHVRFDAEKSFPDALSIAWHAHAMARWGHLPAGTDPDALAARLCHEELWHAASRLAALTPTGDIA